MEYDCTTILYGHFIIIIFILIIIIVTPSTDDYNISGHTSQSYQIMVHLHYTVTHTQPDANACVSL